MLLGDAAAARHSLVRDADEARHPIVSYSSGSSKERQRRRAKSVARALPVNRPSGGGAHPPPPEPPATSGVPLRAAVPHPDRGLTVPQPQFRFWIDEVLWSQGRVAVELLEAVLTEAGGLRTGGPSRPQERSRRLQRQLQQLGGSSASSLRGPPMAAPDGPCLGSQHLDAWEVLWTKSTYAIPAARNMRPGQLVSAIIGLNSLTMKKRLLLTLRDSLGPAAAFAITPRTFALPEELDAWEAWLRREQHRQQWGRGRQQEQEGGGREQRNVCGGGDGGGGLGGSLWILKTGQDAGKGLSLLQADQAVRYARQQQQQLLADRAGGSGGGGRRFLLQVAQQYIGDPFLIGGRKFHLRLWLLVTAHSPLRAYLHRRGLVLFSSELYDKGAVGGTSASAAAGGPGSPAHTPGGGGDGGAGAATDGGVTAPFAPPASHITNYARNNNTLVWSMRQLAMHLGDQSFGSLWARLCGACASALRAAAPSLAEAHAWLRPAVQEYGFQVLGVDFLLDERLTPWLLEANSAPSIMVQHECDATRALVYEQKYGMLRDTWEVVRGRVYARGGEEGRGERAAARSAAQWEAAHAGEYEPLMSYV